MIISFISIILFSNKFTKCKVPEASPWVPVVAADLRIYANEQENIRLQGH